MYFAFTDSERTQEFREGCGKHHLGQEHEPGLRSTEYVCVGAADKLYDD